MATTHQTILRLYRSFHAQVFDGVQISSMLYSVSGLSSYFGGNPVHKKISTLSITPSVSLVAIKTRAADSTLSRLLSLRLSSPQNPLARMSNSPLHGTDMLEKKFEQIDGREIERSVKR